MLLHLILWDLYRALIYKEISNDSVGLCHGFAIRWLEATFLGEEERQRFENRLIFIENTPRDQLLDKLKQAQAKKGEGLTDEDKKVLDILAFFNSLELFHSPVEHKILFNHSSFVTQQSIELVSTIASSSLVEMKRGLKEIYSEPNILTKEELHDYLLNLSKILDETLNDVNTPVGLLLGSHNHAIALSYSTSQGWLFRDINQPLEATTFDQIAEKIKRSFIDTHSSSYVAFNTSIFLTGDNKSKAKLEKLTQLRPSNDFIKAQSLRKSKDGVTLALIAAQFGHSTVITTLAEAGVNLNIAKENGETPVFVAAQNGKADVITALAQAGANLDMAREDGMPPIVIATKYGCIAAIKALAEGGANLDKMTKYGVTAAFVAVADGNTEVVETLLKNHCNFEIPIEWKAQDWINLAMGLAKIKGDSRIIQRMNEFLQENKSERVKIRPYDMAKIIGQEEVIKFIKEHLELTKKCAGIEQFQSINNNCFSASHTFFVADKKSIQKPVQEEHKSIVKISGG
ncbi:ankyrin 3 [Legionella beliardensis]|uniref:Ankyrin 3 n=1 Tax=Legionella beliardensis TaxID=91822 RepID=A0A378HYZ0_9GAMM|nr:ankyrin repeat domain-containing protein [Legionella beliardensis]STX27953.1 ankyrin 3 [Legionella beliardensis]